MLNCVATLRLVSSGSHSDPVRMSSTAPPAHPNTAHSDTDAKLEASKRSFEKAMDGVTGA